MTSDPLNDAVQELYRAMLAHDLPALDRLLADDCTYVHSTGLAETKSAFLDGVRTGLCEYERVKPVSSTATASGDLAVVYAMLDFIGGARGRPHPPTSLITTLVWVRKAGVWQLLLRQATRVP